MGNAETILKFEDLELDRSKAQVHEDWNILPGKLRGSGVTVFSAVHPLSSKKRPFIEKALQASKIYRHPGILKYVEGGFLGSEIIVATEEATPLSMHNLEALSFLQITAGLASIVEALTFLHDKAGVSHNNVGASSIYITSDGLWKLWGFEYLCSFGELTRDHIERINQYCSDKVIPPDDKTRISPAYQHARDSFSFGKFIQDVIAPLISIENDDNSHEAFLSFIKTSVLNKEWTKRPRLSTFFEHSFFQHEFLQLRTDLSNILLLPMDQRDEFIKSLPSMLEKYPDEVVASTLASLLLSHSFLLIPSTATHLMPRLLTPKTGKNDQGVFSVQVFKETILPLILQLFAIHDAAIRKILLAQFQTYASLFQTDILHKHILPQLLLGIKDTDDELVSSTLQCLAVLVPLLGADVVVGKNREHIFATAKPKTKITAANKKKFKNTSVVPQISDGLVKGDNKLEVGLESVISEKLPEKQQKQLSSIPERVSYSDDIPERSSPDGGETIDDDLFVKEDGGLESPSEEQWSDWEEMLDQPTPEIIGVLKVKTPEVDVLPNEQKQENVIRESSTEESTEKNLQTESNLPRGKESSQFVEKSSAMKLSSLRTPQKTRTSQGLGEEYDIMSIKVEKKRDSELDLFADLTPNLLTKNFNLEIMLMEASNKTRKKLPSLSDTLAELNDTTAEEGVAWNDEGGWSPPSETLILSNKEDVCVDKEKISSVIPKNASEQASKPNHLKSEDSWGHENWDSF